MHFYGLFGIFGKNSRKLKKNGKNSNSFVFKRKCAVVSLESPENWRVFVKFEIVQLFL